MQVSIQLAAKVVYEARRALTGVVTEAHAENGADADLPIRFQDGAPFEELTSEQREPLYAEIYAALSSGTSMHDALGQAILDAFR